MECCILTALQHCFSTSSTTINPTCTDRVNHNTALKIHFNSVSRFQLFFYK